MDLHLPLRLWRMIDSKAIIVILLLNFDFYGKSQREVGMQVVNLGHASRVLRVVCFQAAGDC